MSQQDIEMLEDEVDQRICLEAPKFGVTLWRNNCGAFKDATGRWIRFGLANVSKKSQALFKSSDRIGFTEIVITPEMVGKVVAVFTAIEKKKSTWNPDKQLDDHEKAQKNYIDYILLRGGFAGFANSIDSFRKIIRK